MRLLFEGEVRLRSDVWDDAGTCTRGAKGLELRLVRDGTNECHTTVIAKQMKVSGMFRNGMVRNTLREDETDRGE